MSNRQCLDLFDKTYKDCEALILDLQQNFYPECEIVDSPRTIGWVKGWHKYDWFGKIVFNYFGEIYLLNIEAQGNGGWLSIDECKAVAVYKVKSVYYETVQVKKYEI